MRYHLKDPVELERAGNYLASLAGREAVVDITRVSYQRSNQSNSYYHLMLSYFGTQVGSTLEEVKQLIRELQPELYKTTEKLIAGIRIQSSRSSASFNSAEMATSIDRFREWSASKGIEIPAPNEHELLKYVDDVVSQNSNYL